MTKVSDADLLKAHRLLRTDPEHYLALTNAFIRENPSCANGYLSRHHAWVKLGRADLALEDLNTSLALKVHHVTLRNRGHVLRSLERYAEALEDYNRSEALDPIAWKEEFGPLFRADCHARLGDEAAALSDCDQLRADHWTPGVHSTPAGTKAEVIAEIRRLAAVSKRR